MKNKNRQSAIIRISAQLGISQKDATFLYNLLPSSCCPPAPGSCVFKKEEWINPLVGTTVFTLSNIPNNCYPAIVTRGGVQLLTSEYSISGNSLILLDPIASSGGGAGSEDIIITYSY